MTPGAGIGRSLKSSHCGWILVISLVLAATGGFAQNGPSGHDIRLRAP